MRKKLRSVVLLATGLSALVLSHMGGNLITQASADATTEAQKKAAEAQDGVVLLQAHALFGKLPATMPGSEQDTPAMIALGKKLYFEEAVSINNTQSCNSCHPIDNKGASADNRKTGKDRKSVV